MDCGYYYHFGHSVIIKTNFNNKVLFSLVYRGISIKIKLLLTVIGISEMEAGSIPLECQYSYKLDFSIL